MTIEELKHDLTVQQETYKIELRSVDLYMRQADVAEAEKVNLLLYRCALQERFKTVEWIIKKINQPQP